MLKNAFNCPQQNPPEALQFDPSLYNASQLLNLNSGSTDAYRGLSHQHLSPAATHGWSAASGHSLTQITG